MNNHFLKFVLLAGVIAVAGCDKGEKAAQPEAAPPAKEAAAPQEKPAMKQEALITLEATVTAINQETREVTLQNSEGESITFIASDEVRNLAQVEVGDKLKVEYLEAIEIRVLAPGEAEVGAQQIVTGGRAELGEKPAGGAISETTIVAVIEAIDKENQTATLKGPEGNSKVVKVRNPENLEKVAIGDKVIITYTEAMAVKVTEK
jgi:guanyl-specific ribonuclease Sa